MKKFLLTAVFFIAVFFIKLLHAMEATIFRVGQGNSVFVSCPNRRSLLADAGSTTKPIDPSPKKALVNKELTVDYAKVVKEIIGSIVKRTPTKELCIIVSHPDLDHSKWVLQIARDLFAREFDIHILLGGSKDWYDKAFILSLRNCKSDFSKRCRYVFINDVNNDKDFVEQADIEQHLDTGFLPSYCSVVHAQKEGNNSNELCILARVESDGYSILIPADAPKNVTDAILKTKPEALKSDILIAFHHGSAYDNNKELIEAVQPNIIIISAGMHKGIRHPHFATVVMYKDYFEQTSPANNKPHLLTTHYDGNIEPYKSYESALPGFKPVAFDEAGFAHGPTTLPLYNTTNGTVQLTGQLVSQLSQAKASLNFEQLACETSKLAGFRNITVLMLTNLGLTNAELQKTISLLPGRLTYLDMRKNKLGLDGIMYLLSLIKNHEVQLLIKLDENAVFQESELMNALDDWETTCAKINAQASIKAQKEGVSIETLSIGEDTSPTIAKKNRLYYYGKQWDKFPHHIDLSVPVYTIALNCRFVARYTKKRDCVQIWDITNHDKNPRYTIKNPDNEWYVQALLFNMQNTMLGLACRYYTYVWKRDSEIFLQLDGTLRFNDTRAIYSLGAATHRLADFSAGFSLPLLSPFSSDGNFLATLVIKSNCIKIWLLTGAEPKEVMECDLGKRSAKEVTAFYFIDQGQTLRIDFSDKSYHEFPLIMNKVIPRI